MKGSIIQLICSILLAQLVLCIPALKNDTQATDVVQKRSGAGVDIDIGIDSPVFLITIPFYVSTESSAVYGNATIYYKESRSAKLIGDVLNKYFAKVTSRVFAFVFEFNTWLDFGRYISSDRDVLFLERTTATLFSDKIAFNR